MQRDDWNRRYEGAELLWSATPNRRLVAAVDGLAPGRALDVACGEGRNAVWLAEQGWEVTGVDFSEVGLAKARRLAGARGVEVRWVQSDLLAYVPEPAAYDLVVVLYLHLPAGERRAVHGRLAGGVADGGTMVVLGHDRTNLTEGIGGPQDPEILLTPEEVAGELAGLTVERAERVVRPVTTDAGERTAVDALVVAVRR
jgi:SAM-dependent methyltransferase